jgi:lipid A disaccharide synthetase
LANKQLIPELRQNKFKTKNIISELNQMINKSNEDLIADFKNLHRSLLNDDQNKFTNIIDKLI